MRYWLHLIYLHHGAAGCIFFMIIQMLMIIFTVLGIYFIV